MHNLFLRRIEKFNISKTPFLFGFGVSKEGAGGSDGKDKEGSWIKKSVDLKMCQPWAFQGV